VGVGRSVSEEIRKQDETYQSRDHKWVARELCPSFVDACLGIKSKADGSRDKSCETWCAESGDTRKVEVTVEFD